ncbi:protein SDA1 homolog [Ischnura elegans]|uniref:protein SDA1 homolog n=1 Tax=Ischnura elegans TaxID=197161 RepID=UPI001ED87ACE|nr:protein SDA1 homolog [Ischnura elegans]
MVKRNNNRLPSNLPQLQNLVKRDPLSYKDEFLQQYRHFQSTLEVFRLKPDQFNKNLDELVMFLAQVSHCYPVLLETYPQQLMDILESHHTVLDSNMRMSFCRALILLRNKGLLKPTALLSLFFSLLRCQDKSLRKFLKNHIVSDIFNTNVKHKDARLNAALQNFMFGMLKDSNAKAAKMSVDIMIELYKKNTWNDAKSVNVIATALFSKVTKVVVAALKFFLGSDPTEKNSDESDSDEEEVTAKEIMKANKVNKKSRKRGKQLKKAKQVLSNKKKKNSAPAFNFSALHLIHDPQGLAERLFQQLEKKNERFEVKLMTLDIISRLIGLHQLFLFNYYPYIQRFMQPHQREVTRILQFAAQSAHELVPPDIIEPVLKTLVNNFVTERNSSDVIAVGLNAMREICIRCPLAMPAYLLQDLVMYRNYRERSVAMAARSLVSLFRIANPDLLKKRDRGRPTEASLELKVKQYGEIDAKDYIPGAEVLLEEGADGGGGGDDGSDDSEWEDVSHSSDEEVEGEGKSDEEGVESSEEGEEGESDEEGESSGTDEEEDVDEKSEAKKKKEEGGGGGKGKTNSKGEDSKDKVEEAAAISVSRILSDEDFKRIEVARLKKEMTVARKGKKRSRSSVETEDAKTLPNNRAELVSLGDIENIFKKKRHDKEARLETVRKGQEDRMKFGFQDRRQNPFSSKTNREKKKNKNFMMVKHKVFKKQKRSFRDKQASLRNHLLKQCRMK